MQCFRTCKGKCGHTKRVFLRKLSQRYQRIHHFTCLLSLDQKGTHLFADRKELIILMPIKSDYQSFHQSKYFYFFLLGAKKCTLIQPSKCIVLFVWCVNKYKMRENVQKTFLLNIFQTTELSFIIQLCLECHLSFFTVSCQLPAEIQDEAFNSVVSMVTNAFLCVEIVNTVEQFSALLSNNHAGVQILSEGI